MSEHVVIKGVLERILFYNEENHYCVGELKPIDDKGSITLTGKLPNVQCGETLKIKGEWTTHPKHGRQFQVIQFKSELPSSVYGIRKYLGSGLIHGIGKVYADKIVDHFGADTLDVISNHSKRLYEVPGIGRTRAKSIKAAWDEQHSLREVMVFLQTYGVSNAQCVRLVKEYGAQAQSILKNDPYRIAREIDYIGFQTADKIALNLGFPNESQARIDAGLLYVLSEMAGEGHTRAESDPLVSQSAQLLDVPARLVEERLKAMLFDKELFEAPGGGVQLSKYRQMEGVISDSLTQLKEARSGLPPIIVDKAVQWAQDKAGFEFAPEQAEAIAGGLSNNLSVITGGPGTGKTTILRAIVAILRAKKARLLLASPTGRAAQRMSESAGHPASTLHRALNFDASEWRFQVNEGNPLRADCVIIDESSMLDTQLAAALFRAIPMGCHLILVGDVNQLPSVGAGNVLGDCIESGLFKVTRLEQIFRQSKRSAIVGTAHGILHGNTRLPSPTLHIDREGMPDDLIYIEEPDPEACIARIKRLITQELREQGNIDLVKDVQVLAPLHKGLVGISNLNTELQQALNPHAQQGGNPGLLYPGDKVIQMRNNYDKDIYNGDIGSIQEIDQKDGKYYIDFDGRYVELERGDLNSLQLAYAISIHKSQGSEFPIAVIPLLKSHFIMLQRNLVYTALTRARKKAIIVGDVTAYRMAVQNSKSTKRMTGLLERMRG